MEIVTKLCDVEFARRAKAADFLGRAWEVLREAGAGEGDKVRCKGLVRPVFVLKWPLGPGHHSGLLCGSYIKRSDGRIRPDCQI